MAVLLPRMNSGELRNIVQLMTSQALSLALSGVHSLSPLRVGRSITLEPTLLFNP